MTVNCEVRNFKKEKGSKVKSFVLLWLFLPVGTFPHSSCRSGWRCICSAVWLFLACIMCDKGRCDMLSIVYLHEISSIIWICLFKEFVPCGKYKEECFFIKGFVLFRIIISIIYILLCIIIWFEVYFSFIICIIVCIFRYICIYTLAFSSFHLPVLLFSSNSVAL